MHHMQRLEQDSEQLAFFEKAFVTMCLTLQEYRIFAVFLDIVVYKAVLVEARQLLEFFQVTLTFEREKNDEYVCLNMF